MPSDLKQSDINSKTDPSVARQWDDKTPKDQQMQDFYKIADGLKICMMGTYRPQVGPLSRSMAVAKRTGPDFLFLANAHSQKFKDIEKNPEVQLSFHDKTTQDWISVTGTAATASNSDPRIKQIWNRGAAAWFGDLGDGVHDGSADDPRMSLIEVKSKYISYYKAEAGALGYLKEIVAANITGGVANTGSLRQLLESDIATARSKHSDLSS